VYHDDDKKDDCFRKYKYVENSYNDHSKFLTTRRRYAFLFKIRKTNYKAWAKGLKKAGYATDRRYHTKLIKIIQDYKLYEFDKVKKSDLKKFKKALKKSNPKVVPVKTKMAPKTIKKTSSSKAAYVVRKGDTLYSISRKTGVSVKQLKKLNGLKGNTIHIGRRLKLK
jgi:LysM repeat protein